MFGKVETRSISCPDSDSKAEIFKGSGVIIYQSLHFLFCVGNQVTVIDIQKILDKCLDLVEKLRLLNRLPVGDIEYIYPGHSP